MQIAPSILTADFCELGRLLDELVSEGIDWIHLDVMDGNWVVNKTITFGPSLVQSVRQKLGKEIFIDCHLMINNAEETWEQYVNAGVNLVIFHIEAVNNPLNLIENIQSRGCEAGIVLNPDTPVSEVMPFLSLLDLVLVMSVIPGKGGQSFMPEMEIKVRNFRAAIDRQVATGGKPTKLMIDGGIKHYNVALVKSWGIDVAVIGSGIINNTASVEENLKEIISSM